MNNSNNNVPTTVVIKRPTSCPSILMELIKVPIKRAHSSPLALSMDAPPRLPKRQNSYQTNTSRDPIFHTAISNTFNINDDWSVMDASLEESIAASMSHLRALTRRKAPKPSRWAASQETRTTLVDHILQDTVALENLQALGLMSLIGIAQATAAEDE